MSKVLPFKIPKPEKEALVYQEDREKIFYDKLHHHEEIQISYILKGSGSLVVGDTIGDYHEQDLLVIGGNIPHVFRSDARTSESVMYSLFFAKDSFGKDFFEVSDLEGTADFFRESEYGIRVLSNREELSRIFRSLKGQNRIERIASLLRILSITGGSEREPLSSFVYRKSYSDAEGKRMRAVFDYAMQHYDRPLSLAEMAEKASMSRNAFCRYFKRHTNKTFFRFLTEIRIENAASLLFRNDLPISEIAELCGFQNISNFNRKFRELKGCTPTAFRAKTRNPT